jgi:hypothetical protein
MEQVWVNLTDYTVLQHLCFAVGCFLWVIVYIIVIKNIRKFQFIEIPMVAICFNFAWEILWSWVFDTDMGLLYQWGYRAWFFLDCFIVYNVFKYGHKQLVSMPKKFAEFILITGFLMAISILYPYIKIYDAPISHMGGYTGFLVNLFNSALFISLIVRKNNIALFSEWVAWLKFFGTGLVTVFAFLKFTDPFLLVMGVVVAVLDIIYIMTYYKIKNGQLNVSME